MIKNFRDTFALVYIIVLLTWLLVAIFYLVPLVINSPAGTDPMMTMLAGLGIGAITQFLIVIGTLIFQFYFRKKEDELPKT